MDYRKYVSTRKKQCCIAYSGVALCYPFEIYLKEFPKLCLCRRLKEEVCFILCCNLIAVSFVFLYFIVFFTTPVYVLCTNNFG